MFFSYLLILGDEDGARKAIMFFHQCGSDMVEDLLDEVKENLKISVDKMTVIDVVKDEYACKGSIVGIVISSACCFSGNSRLI